MKSTQLFAAAAFTAMAALSSVAHADTALFANNGEIGAPVTAVASSTTDRATVRMQAVQASRAGQITTGDYTMVSVNAPSVDVDRAEVRAQAQQALHAGQIALGDLTVM
jgi:hypothetical protein